MKRVATDVETFHLGIADLDAFLLDVVSRAVSTLRPVLVLVAAINSMMVA
jgi:hypothetical protein